MAGRGRGRKPVSELIDWDAVAAQDEDCKSRGFKLREKLREGAFEDTKETMLDTMTGRELTLEYIQRSGFVKPILVQRRDDLGLKVPPRDLSVEGIRSAVGSRRMLEVLDVMTQKTQSMCMKDWCRYWSSEPREETLNGLSLEFSKTKLDQQVTAPTIVRKIDWIEKAWPKHLKELQEDSGNNISDMMYPKVQKFVIMSVANSYVDFHLDFGGTSVWYYVLRGHKVFWLIPPTDKNLILYEGWVKNKDKQGFFGDQAEGCYRVDLSAGNTLFVPSGWLHAVFTPRDAVVFSGSFLHSYAIEKQLKICFIEEALRVPLRFQFPFNTEMLWYVLDRYVTCLTGQSHIDLPDDVKIRLRLEKGEHIDPNKEFINPGMSEEGPVVASDSVHLTQPEVRGLMLIVYYLHTRPMESKDVPVMIPNPVSLLGCVKKIIESHKDDCPEKAVTGKYVLRWTEDDDVEEDYKSKKIIPNPADFTARLPDNPMSAKAGSAGRDGSVTAGGMEAPRRRRARCGACPGCREADCRTCPACRDMTKYGGPGRLKQSCVKRKCARPTLPVAAACSVNNHNITINNRTLYLTDHSSGVWEGRVGRGPGPPAAAARGRGERAGGVPPVLRHHAPRLRARPGGAPHQAPQQLGVSQVCRGCQLPPPCSVTLSCRMSYQNMLIFFKFLVQIVL